MKRLKIVLTLALMLVSNLIFSQCRSTTIMHPIRDRFKVGDMYYSSNYKGLKLLMADTEIDQPGLHTKLSPVFKDIRRKRNNAVASFVTGGVIGTTMLIGANTFLQKNDNM
jgi:hypothetical protein